ncbi:MAG: MFS transporter [Clostridia bacterium]|nr:MFS transporter [Clostridia bacterium]
MFKNEKVRNALLLGVLCSVSYLAVYIARNVLGAVTPQMLNSGLYTEQFIGTLSSAFFYFYAFGQLINGILGQKINARNMMSFGLILAGVFNFVFPYIKGDVSITLVYGLMGFCLSMIYAPMTKVVAENTEPIHAVRCSLGYTFASFFGSPVAGILASFMVWQSVFTVSSISLWVMGAVTFVSFLILEKKKIVVYGRFDKKKGEKKEGAIKELVKRDIIAFTIVSIITGVIRTTVIFWMPTYFNQYLGFSEKVSTSVYSASTLVICASSFVSIFIYERMKRTMSKPLLLMFSVSAIAFVCMYFFHIPVVNVVLMIMGIFFSNCATTILWSVYCNSLKDTGVVSGATGFLDFVSYMAAGISSTLFANSVNTIGWGNLILVWAGLMVVGVLTAIYLLLKDRRKSEAI